VAAALVVVAAGGCANKSGSSGKSNEYTVYAVIDQTGALGPVYSPGADGVRAFFDQLNGRGGVNGKKIKLVVRDSQSTSDSAQAQYRQAIDAHPVAIFSLSASTGVSAAAPLLVNSGIPVLGVGISDDLLYPTPKSNIYMLQPTSQQQIKYGLGLVEHLTGGSLSGKRIAMVGLSPSSIIDTAYQKIRTTVESAGGSIANIQRPTSPVASFATQAVVLAKAKPDAVFLNLAPADAVTVAKALKDAGLQVPLIVLPSSGTDAPQVFQAINSGHYYAVRFVRPPSETDQASAAGDKYGSSATWETGWMFGQIVAAGLQQCGATCDLHGLNEALQSAQQLDVGKTAYAPVHYSKDDHETVSAVQYYVWDAAQQKPVEAGDVIDVQG
jgi:ABC-type branched-subunit amino acid transport system substrate-binding protein